MSSKLDPLIQAKLCAFAQRRRRLIIVKGVLAAAAILLCTMLLVALVDFAWLLPDWLRWSLSAVAYLAVLVVVWRQCLRQLIHAPDKRQLARLVEHAEPGLREDLISAVELGQTDGEIFDSEQFRALLQQDVARRMGGVEMKSLLPVGLIRRTIGWAAAIVVMAFVMMAVSGWRLHTLLLRALLPGANLERVSRTKVTVQEPDGGDRIVPQGDTVRVVVQLSGEPSNRARIETMGESGGWQVMNMEPLPNGRFAATVQVGRASVRYRIKAGDALTRKYLLDARERPYVTDFAKAFHFPKYSELPDRSVTEKDGALIALEGTEVDLKLKTNQPVKRAELLIEQGKTSATQPLVVGADGTLSGKIAMTASGSYRVHLVGAETNFENKFSPENEIRAEPDLLPSVELEQPKQDLILPANEFVDITGTASDDLGIAKVVRLVRVNDGGWKQAVLMEKPGKQARISDRWDLFQSGVKPGDLLTMKLAVTDLKGSRAESRPLQVTITASGFEMRRIQGLDALRAMNESVRALADHALQLQSAVRKAIDGASGADKESAAKQSSVAIAGAATEFEAKFTEAWTALGAAMREAKGGHAAAELATLGRTLARMGFGSAKIVRADAGAIAVLPVARNAQKEAVETASDIARRAKAAAAFADVITLSEESAVIAESGIILQREQKRLMDMASAAGDNPAQWAALASRLRVAASQSKLIEDIMAPMAGRSGSAARDRAKSMIQQMQKHREAFAKSFMPDDKPDRRMLQKLADFNRGIEQSARTFGDWNRELAVRSAPLMREAAQDAGPAFAAVPKLAEALEAIRREPTYVDQARTVLADARWRICAELFKAGGDLEEIRRHADNQYVSDLRHAVAAAEGLRAVAPGTDPAEVRAKLDELETVLRVLESGHNLQEAMDGFVQLASSERWEVRDLAARTDAPRDWRWLEVRMTMIPDELGRAKPAKVEPEIGKVFADAQQILWKAMQLEAWRAMSREFGVRTDFNHAPVSARQHAEQIAGQVKLALDLFRKPMEDARRRLAKLSPTVSQLASALAKEQAEVKKETEKRAKNEAPKNPEDAKADAERQIAQQQQINEKVETLKDLVRADANKQDIMQKEQRERMRDADDALAMLKDPPPKAEQALQDAAAAAPDQQRADLERAAEQQKKLADALKQIAEHFEKMERGKPADDSRTALREAEKELGIKEQLDAQQAHAQMLAEMAEKDPQQLLKELEAKLPENPAMQKELSAISKNALVDAEERLADARNREDNVAKQLDAQARQENAAVQQANQGAVEAAKQAQQAAQMAKQAAENAEQQAKAAGNADAEKQAAQAKNEAAKAAQSAQQASDAAEKMTKAGDNAQAAEAAKKTAQKAGEAAQSAQQAMDAAKQAAAATQQAAQQPGEHQAQNQQANQRSAEAARQAQKAADAAKRAQQLAQQSAAQAEAMQNATAQNQPQGAQERNSPQAPPSQPGTPQSSQNNPAPGGQQPSAQQNPQLGNAAQQQQPVAANAADAADTTDRAGRHEMRLANQQAGEQLQKLAENIRETANKQVPAAQQALENAKAAQQAQAPVNAASSQLTEELKDLRAALNGQPQKPDSAMNSQPQAPQMPPQAGQQAQASPMQQGQQAGTPESAQAAQSSTQANAPQQPGQSPQGAQQSAQSAQSGQQQMAKASAAEQQAMARALDALDQQLNPSTSQQANAQGQSQQGQQGQQQNGQQQGQQQSNQNQQGQQGQQAQQGNQQGQPGQQGKQGQQSAAQNAMQQAAQAAQASMRQERSESSSTKPGSLLAANQSDKSMGGAKADGTAMDVKALPNSSGLKRGDWGRLPKKLAEQLTKGSQEAVPGEYRQAVETYYRVIAEKTKKRQ